MDYGAKFDKYKAIYLQLKGGKTENEFVQTEPYKAMSKYNTYPKRSKLLRKMGRAASEELNLYDRALERVEERYDEIESVTHKFNNGKIKEISDGNVKLYVDGKTYSLDIIPTFMITGDNLIFTWNSLDKWEPIVQKSLKLVRDRLIKKYPYYFDESGITEIYGEEGKDKEMFKTIVNFTMSLILDETKGLGTYRIKGKDYTFHHVIKKIT